MSKIFCVFCATPKARENLWEHEVPKQLLVVDNETLLERTTRLVSELDENSNSDIYVIAKSEKFHTNYSKLYLVPEEDNDIVGVIQRFLQVKNLWWNYDEVVFLYGDVWYSEEAISKISSYKGNNIQYFGRAKESNYTGKKHQEIYGMYCSKDCYSLLEENILKTVSLFNEGKVWRVADYQLYEVLHNMPFGETGSHIKPTEGDWMEIDDFTEDFDLLSHFNEWIKRYNKK